MKPEQFEICFINNLIVIAQAEPDNSPYKHTLTALINQLQEGKVPLDNTLF